MSTSVKNLTKRSAPSRSCPVTSVARPILCLCTSRFSTMNTALPPLLRSPLYVTLLALVTLVAKSVVE